MYVCSHLPVFVDIPTVILDKRLRHFTTLVTVGSSIELKCDIKGSTDLKWKRNGAPLDKLTGSDVKVHLIVSYAACVVFYVSS